MNTRKVSLPPFTMGDLPLLLLKHGLRLLATLKPVVIEWVHRGMRAAQTGAGGFIRFERLVPARRWLITYGFRSPAGPVVRLAPASGNQPATFQQNSCQGLRTAEQQLLPPEYDAVWPMLGGKFWGFRKGTAFGVIATDGTEVIPCSLPARYQGYRELGTEDEHRALQVSKTRFLSYLREQHLGLHITGSKLCQPAAWMVEEVTPHLGGLHNSLSFETSEFTLLLWDNGTWAWRQPPSIPRPKDIVHATADPVTLSETSPRLFTEATADDLLEWRLRYGRPGGDPEGEMQARWDQEINEKVAAEYEQLVDVPTTTPDWWDQLDAPFYLFFTPDFFPPHVLRACLKYLQAFPPIHQQNRPYVERLIYLAWLWANGYVRKTCLPPYYVVDARYVIDSEWYDNVPIQEVYLNYQLQALAPLLAEMT